MDSSSSHTSSSTAPQGGGGRGWDGWTQKSFLSNISRQTVNKQNSHREPNKCLTVMGDPT